MMSPPCWTYSRYNLKDFLLTKSHVKCQTLLYQIFQDSAFSLSWLSYQQDPHPLTRNQTMQNLNFWTYRNHYLSLTPWFFLSRNAIKCYLSVGNLSSQHYLNRLFHLSHLKNGVQEATYLQQLAIKQSLAINGNPILFQIQKEVS